MRLHEGALGDGYDERRAVLVTHASVHAGADDLQQAGDAEQETGGGDGRREQQDGQDPECKR